VIVDAQTAASIVEVSSAAIVVIGIVLAATRSIGRSIWLVALQAALAGVAAISVGLGAGVAHLAFVGVLTIGIKGLAIPVVLGSILRRSAVRRERHLLLDPRVCLVAAVLIVFAASAAAGAATLGTNVAASSALTAAIAEVLTGLLLVMTRRKALSLVVGLLVFENGIALTAFSLTYGMPLVVELGIVFDLLIAVIVAWVYTRRMLDVFGSTSTDQMRSLRG
jgi:hydrogenase-4 component E